jgi:hypothetical protein
MGTTTHAPTPHKATYTSGVDGFFKQSSGPNGEMQAIGCPGLEASVHQVRVTVPDLWHHRLRRATRRYLMPTLIGGTHVRT